MASSTTKSTAWLAHGRVVGDDDDALAHVRGRAVEDRDRHVGVLRLGDDGGAGLAVLRDQDDAVDALRDAVLDLLELAVGVLPAVALDDLEAAPRSASW